MKKRKILSSILCILVSVNMLGASVSGVRVVNNTSPNSDYKLDEESLSTLNDKIKTRSEITEYFTQEVAGKLTDNEVIDYLIENNIVSRESKINFSEKDGMEIETPRLNYYTKLNKTQMLMMIYKTCYGVIPSRPFIYKCDSRRLVDKRIKTISGKSEIAPSNYNDNDTSFNYNGDYEVYISPNVEELYLTELLNRGVIKKSEIKDKLFIQEYEAIQSENSQTLPEWWNELQPYNYTTSKVDPSTQLGRSWKFKGIFRTFDAHASTFYMEKSRRNFFVNDSLNKLEFYNYIIKIKDIKIDYTKEEFAKLGYMYGNFDIGLLDDNNKSIMYYLIDNGILDSNDTNEIDDLDGSIEPSQVLEILYRLHNESGRVNNTVELSEDDLRMIQDGYTKEDIDIIDVEKSVTPVTISIEQVNNSSPVSMYKFNFADKVKDVTAYYSDGKGNTIVNGKLVSGTIPEGYKPRPDDTVNVSSNNSSSDTNSNTSSSSNNSTTTEIGLKGKTIVIDPGHGSSTVKVPNSDKTYLETYEKSKPNDESSKDTLLDTGGAPGEYKINWSVAQKLKSNLEAKGAKVILTKSSEEANAGNQERAKVANDNNAAIMIRLHCDDSESRGTGAFYCMPDDTSDYFTDSIKNTTKDYSEKIVAKVSSATGVAANDPILEPLTAAYWCKVPSVLIEMGNLADATEKSKLGEDDFQNKLAKGLTDGILDCVGEEQTTESNNTSNPSPSTSTGSTNATVTANKVEANADVSSVSTYKITRLFPKPEEVTYGNKKISELSTGDDVKEAKDDASGKLVVFEIKARSDIDALALLDSKTNYTVIPKSTEKMQTVTKIESDGVKNTYVSATELGKMNGEIEILANKVLQNRLTGTTCVLLEDNDTALVGNRIIKSTAPMVIINTAETYYNLECIAALMTNTYLSKLDPGKLFKSWDLQNEYFIDVNGSAGTVERTKVINNIGIDDITFKGNQFYYDVTNVTRGVSTLVRSFTIGDKQVDVVVDWAYQLPEGNDTIHTLAKQTDFNVEEASKFLYTQSEDSTLSNWWDSNIELSNALANLLYGTNGIEYIKSGYLKPNISLLLYDGAKEDDAIKSIFSNLDLSKSYLDKYCGGSLDNFKDNLFKGSGDPTGSRKLSSFEGKKSDKTGYSVFGETYITAPTGSVYKAVKTDQRIEYNETDKVLNLKGRTNAQSNYNNTMVDLNGKSYLLTTTSVSGRGFFKLVSSEPVIGILKEKPKIVQGTANNQSTNPITANSNKFQNNTNTLQSTDYQLVGVDNNSVDALYEATKKCIDDAGLQDGEYRKLSTYSYSDFAGLPSPTTLTAGKDIFVGNKLYTFDASSPSKMKENALTNYNNHPAIAYPAIYLNQADFKVEDGKIVRGQSNPYLEDGNVFFSGIASSVMSSLIDNQLESTRYKMIPTGAQVLIGDYRFTKSTNGLNSEPVTNSSQVTEIISAAGTSNLNTVIASKFMALNIMYSGRNVPFTSYIKSVDVGNFLNGTANNTVYKDSSQGLLFKENNESNPVLYSNQTPSSICFNMVLDDDLEFYCIDASKKVYVMKIASDKYSDGYINKSPFFDEDLGFQIYDDAYFDMYTSMYKGVINYQQYFDETNKYYSQLLKSDIVHFFQGLVACFLMYLILASWVVIAVLKLNVGLSILLTLRNPSGMSGGEGPDPIKIISLGLYNLDSNPNIGVLLVGDLLLFLLLYVDLYLADIVTKFFL